MKWRERGATGTSGKGGEQRYVCSGRECNGWRKGRRSGIEREKEERVADEGGAKPPTWLCAASRRGVNEGIVMWTRGNGD